MTPMTPEFDQRIADWLEHDPDLAPRQVTETVLAALPSIPQRRRRWIVVGRRTTAMPNSMRLAAAVAIVAALGVGAMLAIGSKPQPPVPTAIPTVSPTNQPTSTLPQLGEGVLAPGRYAYEGDGVRVIVTVPAGWEGGGSHVSTAPARELPDGANLGFLQPDRVYPGWCGQGAQPLGPTVDDLANFLTGLSNRTESTEADVTISGFSGRHLSFTVQTEGIDCIMVLYGVGSLLRAADDGQHQDVWILDVAGTRLVIDAATYPETSAAVRAEVQAMVDTLVIEPID